MIRKICREFVDLDNQSQIYPFLSWSCYLSQVMTLSGTQDNIKITNKSQANLLHTSG